MTHQHHPSPAHPGRVRWHTLISRSPARTGRRCCDRAEPGGSQSASEEVRPKRVHSRARRNQADVAFLRQYQDPMQILLLVAAIASLFIQQWGTALLLIVLTLFNALLALRQEGKAEASVAALQKMMIVKSRVRRGGQVIELPAEQIVPGDIVLLEAGDRVTADGRIIRAATLEIGESALTGESAPVPKEVAACRQSRYPAG